MKNLNQIFEKVLREHDSGVCDADEDTCERVYQIFKKACEEVAQFVDIDAEELNGYIGQYFSDHEIFYYG